MASMLHTNEGTDALGLALPLSFIGDPTAGIVGLSPEKSAV